MDCSAGQFTVVRPVSYWSSSYITALSLVESFIVMLCFPRTNQDCTWLAENLQCKSYDQLGWNQTRGWFSGQAGAIRGDCECQSDFTFKDEEFLCEPPPPPPPPPVNWQTPLLITAVVIFVIICIICTIICGC